MTEVCSGKVAVITGATGGIGAAVAQALSAADYRLVLSARSSEKLTSLTSELPGPAVSIAGDLCDAALPQGRRGAHIATRRRLH